MTATLSTLTHIWTPLTIGHTTVKNRILMPAETIVYAENHIISDRHIAYYRERALGGAALIVTEQQAAHRLSKGSFHAGCTAWEKRVIPQYAKLADTVHVHGTKLFVQLFTCGVHDKGTMIVDEWHPLWGASRLPSIAHRETPMVMGQAEIDELAKGFGDSAVNVQVSGLDGIEVHGAHSYGRAVSQPRLQPADRSLWRLGTEPLPDCPRYWRGNPPQGRPALHRRSSSVL